MKNRVAVLFLSSLLSTGLECRSQTANQEPTGASPRSPGGVLRLSLKEAVDIALGAEGNPRVRIAEETVSQSKSRSAQARSALLPNLEASVGQSNRTQNLEAYGLMLRLPVLGFQFPTLVGPYGLFDARATASQSAFDLSAIRRYQASRTGIDQAQSENENVQDLITGVVARNYLAAVRADAAVQTAAANLKLAQELLDLAFNMKAAGSATGIEVTRARVQLSQAQQRLLVAENERQLAYFQLLNSTGMDLTTPVELTQALAFLPVDVTAPDQAVKIAFESRNDWKAQVKRQESAELAYSSVKWERLPSVGLFGDYGTIGTSINNAIPTRAYGFTVKVPVFDGGRRDARRAESASQLRQEHLRTQELRDQIDLQVRTALDNLKSSIDLVKTAEEGLALSESELAQAERRYKSGVGTSLEVTDAQTRLQHARDDRILALYYYNLSRINLGTAMGTIRRMIQ
jgi:outer membrane protein